MSDNSTLLQAERERAETAEACLRAALYRIEELKGRQLYLRTELRALAQDLAERQDLQMYVHRLRYLTGD